MILKHTDGTHLRYWGVAEVKERRSIKKKFYGPEGELLDSFFHAQEAALLDSLDGLPSPIENVRKLHYVASITAAGRLRHLGIFATPRAAALGYDSGLFYLWGYLINPNANRFNLASGDQYCVTPPPLLKGVLRVLKKLQRNFSTGTFADFEGKQDGPP